MVDLSTDNLKSLFKKYRNLIIAIGLVLILAIAGISLFTDWFGNWLDLRKITGWKTEINAVNADVTNINANLANLEIQNAVQGVEVNALNANHDQAMNATNNARNQTNQALNNLNHVEGTDFNGTSLDKAKRARCKAFPDRPECRQ